jgi:NAD(P)-dependent dehydrogenase (short-subunit alcohol dehydrogenase family)
MVKKSSSAMLGKTCVVTGCGADSIGEATALALAQQGAQVCISTRQGSAQRAAAIAQLAGVPAAQVQGHDLDLLSTSSTAAFAAWVQKQTPALDVLVNNAGVHLDLLRDHKSPQIVVDEAAEGAEIHWRCNYLGTAQLTFSLLPLLLQTASEQGQARLVNVVSMLHSKGQNRWMFAPQTAHDSWVSYGTSKLALMHLSLALHERYHAQGLRTYSLHPGAVSTRVADKGLQERPALAALRRAFLPLEKLFLLSPTQGARTSVHCATAADADAASGLYWRSRRPAQASAELQDAASRSRLWQSTQDWLQIQGVKAA